MGLHSQQIISIERIEVSYEVSAFAECSDRVALGSVFRWNLDKEASSR